MGLKKQVLSQNHSTPGPHDADNWPPRRGNLSDCILPAVSLRRWLWHPPGTACFPVPQVTKRSLSPLRHYSAEPHKDPRAAQR